MSKTPIVQLRALRYRHHIPLKELATELDCSHQSVNEMELLPRGNKQTTLVRYQNAIEKIISNRRNSIDALEAEYMQCKDHLFDIVWEELF